ncbi:hypothetical protein Tco_0732004 [Tanacetum coccineum]
MIIEIADDTKCIPKGIVKDLLIKTDKFILPVDFVILDMIKDFNIPVILERPLLATTHVKVDIFRMTISLKVGNEKVQESYKEIVYRCSLIAQEANGRLRSNLTSTKKNYIGVPLFLAQKMEFKKYWPLAAHLRENVVGIKRLLDYLRVTAAKLMLLVYKLLLLVFRVNAAITKLQLLKRLRLLEYFLLSEKG